MQLTDDNGFQIKPLAVTVRQAAEVLGVSRSLTYELGRRGELRFIKIGRATRVPLSELEAFVARRLEDDGVL